MTEQMHRDKISNLYQSGVTNAMEVFRRTGIPKSTVYQTISKFKFMPKFQLRGREVLGKAELSTRTILFHLSNLLETIDTSIRKLTSEFNTTRSNTYSRETVPQEAGTYPKGCQANSVPHTEAYRQTRVLGKG